MTHPHHKHHDTRDNVRDAAILYGAYKSGQAAKELRFQSWWITLTPAEQAAYRAEQAVLRAQAAREQAEAERQARLAQEARDKRVVKAWEAAGIRSHLQWIVLPSLLLGGLVYWIASATDNDSAPVVPGVLRISLILFAAIEVLSWARYFAAKGREAERAERSN
jgi:hypothetical protein